jgi:oligopeptide transport system ATP-binding protein
MSEKAIHPQPLLRVENLTTRFYTDDGIIPAVEEVSFEVGQGETLGIVGESGCGKSITSLSIMRLLPYACRVANGRILFNGEDLLKKSTSEMRKIRGNEISMIFQEPMTSLNPVYPIGEQIAEAIRLHQGLKPREALEKALEIIKMVGIPLPERRINEYPHQLSGGMCQRVMIAMALSCRPKLLIADEPTTALDVTIQAQILQLMDDMKQKLGMSIIFITHNLGVIAEMAQRIIVMYAGKIVEESPTELFFRQPLHPYSEGLMLSMPYLVKGEQPLHMIPGNVPSFLNMPTGCRFHPRCPYRRDICIRQEPQLEQAGRNRRVRCWLKKSL